MAEKTERFGLVLSPYDKQLLESLAKERGESRAVVLRDLIRVAATKSTTTTSKDDINDLVEIE